MYVLIRQYNSVYMGFSFYIYIYIYIYIYQNALFHLKQTIYMICYREQRGIGHRLYPGDRDPAPESA